MPDRNRNEHIIERPHLQTLRQRYGFGLLTALFWVLFLYLLRPLLTLFAWLIGFQLFSREMVVQEGYRSLLRLLNLYGLVTLVIVAVLGGWALYNLFRFRGKEKRRNFPHSIGVEMMASFYEIDPEDLKRWREANRLVMHHSIEGKILKTDPS